ncbi:MAG: hypothetical protein MJB12_01085 [Firmicutes bacterium]|nr:hypothetical protein [Bacillota bacterium]
MKIRKWTKRIAVLMVMLILFSPFCAGLMTPIQASEISISRRVTDERTVGQAADLLAAGEGTAKGEPAATGVEDGRILADSEAERSYEPFAVNPPPGEVTSLTATPGDSQAGIHWIDPVDEDLKLIKIAEETGAVADAVYAQPGQQAVTITGLTNGMLYTFRVTTIDTSDNESEGVTIGVMPAPDSSVENGLIGAWDFENVSGNTVPDESVNSNDGVLRGKAGVVATEMGQSLNLTGEKGTFMYTPLNVNTATQDMTVSIWYKVDASLFDGQTAPSGNLMLFQQEGKGRSLLYVLPNQHMASFIGGSTIRSKKPIGTGSWQHVVMTIDSAATKLAMYFDGVKDSEVKSSNFANEPNAGFRIGDHKSSHNLAFNGLVDQVKIYNRVLSDQEIKALFDHGITEAVAKEKATTAIGEWEELKRTYPNVNAALYGELEALAAEMGEYLQGPNFTVGGCMAYVERFNALLADYRCYVTFADVLSEAENVYNRAKHIETYVDTQDFPTQLCAEFKALIDQGKAVNLNDTDVQTIRTMTDTLIAKQNELDAAITLLNIVFVDVDINNVINTTSKDNFGSNHRYGGHGYGMWDPENRQAYPEFDALYREAGLGSLRYPGGTIANLFEWKRSIGPVEQRKRTIHGKPYGNPPQDTDFGLDEAVRYAQSVDSTLVYVYNIGNGSAADAADLIEYLNAEAGTNPNGGIAWADVRAANGHPEPYNVFNFEIGNEVYLSYQRYWINGSGEGSYQYRYVNGGEFSFTKQNVVAEEDWRKETALSDGTANQEKYIQYVPLKLGTAEVFVDDVKWDRVDSLEGHGAANVYTLSYETGKITFGDGVNGNIPLTGAKITASYTCIKDGFKDYVTAMKAVDPRVKVYSCLHDNTFFKEMGNFKYAGVAIHPYGVNNGKANMEEYHDHIMTTAEQRVNPVRNLINKVKSIDSNMNVIVSEYGILGGSSQYRKYCNSTGDALYVAKTLMRYSKLPIPYANKHCTIDTVGRRDTVGVGEMALIQRYADENDNLIDFVLSPTALVLQMFSKNFGRHTLKTFVANNPAMNGNPSVKKLDVLSSKDETGNMYVMIANTDRLDDVTAVISLEGMTVANTAQVVTLESPAFNSQNTPQSPHTVKLVESSIGGLEGKSEIIYTFPKHSVVVIKLSPKA